ncbi:hypothetical protein SIM91_05030 [Rhodococcus opacus]|uniref:hypothetical protein n=1 Tax=Rhodococcus opacus TaxID=37919 RepID=UPI0002FC2EA8|nr:hypothetical protein [Rhodococcus opacus]MDX5962687.1 hypothetical protein [Rhodococcus opacus]
MGDYPKLRRAIELRDELHDFMVENLKSPTLVSRSNGDDQTNPVVRMEWKLADGPLPDYERGALLLGDVVHNLRAALDHAMWQVTPDTVRSARPTTVQLPICDSRKAFETWKKKQDGCYPEKVLEVLDTAQPFHAPPEQLHPLAILQYLSNTDKHRLLNVVNHAAVDIGPVTVRPEPKSGVRSWKFSGNLKEGETVAWVEWDRTQESYGVNVSPQLAFQQHARYIDRAERVHWLVVGEMVNTIMPYAGKLVGYLVVAAGMNGDELLSPDG